MKKVVVILFMGLLSLSLLSSCGSSKHACPAYSSTHANLQQVQVNP